MGITACMSAQEFLQICGCVVTFTLSLLGFSNVECVTYFMNSLPSHCIVSYPSLAPVDLLLTTLVLPFICSRGVLCMIVAYWMDEINVSFVFSYPLTMQSSARDEILASGGSLSHHHGGTCAIEILNFTSSSNNFIVYLLLIFVCSWQTKTEVGEECSLSYWC